MIINGGIEQIIGREGEIVTFLMSQKRSFIGHFLNLFKILSGLIKSCYKTKLKNKISKQMV
jgi:hypothetical protein